MNFGPMEFAAHLAHKDARRTESAAVKAARDAAPVSAPPKNQLTIISGPAALSRPAGDLSAAPVCVFEAVAMRPPSAPSRSGPLEVRLRRTTRPVVLVLSSHQTVEWRLDVASDATLEAVLLSGYGDSIVTGAGAVRVASIGGFYAFKRGSAEYRHLEDEIRRRTGRPIDSFQSVYAGHQFDIGG